MGDKTIPLRRKEGKKGENIEYGMRERGEREGGIVWKKKDNSWCKIKREEDKCRKYDEMEGVEEKRKKSGERGGGEGGRKGGRREKDEGKKKPETTSGH